MTDHATSAIIALAAAFRGRDPEQALRCFADDPGIVYIGSEPDELAVGPEALRELFTCIFRRDEAYSWTAQHVWSFAQADLHAVVAVLTGSTHRAAGTAETFPYRMSGVVRVEHGTARWLLCHAAEPTH
jgi:hypothetical protein